MTRGAPDREWSVARPLAIGLVALAALVGGFGSWAVAARITAAVVAEGQIEVDRNRQVVQHPDGGVVERVHVDEGDTVQRGDLLLRLDADDLRSELAVTEAQLFELMARRARFEAERDDAAHVAFDPVLLDRPPEQVARLMDGQVRLFEARRETVASEKEQLRKRREQITDQIAGIEAQRAAIRRQLALIEDELTSQRSLLDRGLSQASRVLALEREQADLEGRAGELGASAAQARGRVTELDIQLLGIDKSRREEAITRLRDLEYNEAELAERRRSLLRRLERLDIRAPVTGTVYGLQVFAPRSVIKPADPILFIVPADRPLVIAARVPTTDIDQLHVGQEVALRFSALDQRRTPELRGRVTKISGDAFEDQQQANYYRVEIVLDQGEVARLPEGTSLIPGMPVESFMATDARSPISYLVKPLTDYFAKAFRES